MKTSTLIAYSAESLNNALAEFIETQFHPTVAIGFSSPLFSFNEASDIFKRNNIQLIGCTTSGEIGNDAIVKDSFSALLMDISPDYFKVISFRHENVEAFSSGTKLIEIAESSYSKPGIILFISGIEVVGDGPVEGIRSRMKTETPIYGGLAGDNLQHDATYTFTQDGSTDFGISAVIFDTEKIQMKGLAVSGWQPLGRTHTITRSEKNIIYEIDGKPALDLFLNYFGNMEYKASKNDGAFSIPGQYPLKLYRENGSSYLRSLLIYDTENHALMAAGKVPSGSRFKFCPPPDFSVIQETVEQFRQFSHQISDIDALVMISCKGRHTSFGPLLEDEVKDIYDIWNVPMAGFLANGEIGNTLANGICEFHNISCSIVTLKEL